eukprot:5843944-Alexandrium_andersonii.AAC.1
MWCCHLIPPFLGPHCTCPDPSTAPAAEAHAHARMPAWPSWFWEEPKIVHASVKAMERAEDKE